MKANPHGEISADEPATTSSTQRVAERKTVCTLSRSAAEPPGHNQPAQYNNTQGRNIQNRKWKLVRHGDLYPCMFLVVKPRVNIAIKGLIIPP